MPAAAQVQVRDARDRAATPAARTGGPCMAAPRGQPCAVAPCPARPAIGFLVPHRAPERAALAICARAPEAPHPRAVAPVSVQSQHLHSSLSDQPDSAAPPPPSPQSLPPLAPLQGSSLQPAAVTPALFQTWPCTLTPPRPATRACASWRPAWRRAAWRRRPPRSTPCPLRPTQVPRPPAGPGQCRGGWGETQAVARAGDAFAKLAIQSWARAHPRAGPLHRLCS